MRIEPLWVRVERNRLRLVAFLAVFLMLWALAFVVVLWLPSVLVLGLVASFASRFAEDSVLVGLSHAVISNLGLSALLVALAGVVSSALYAAYTLAQPLRRQLSALGVWRVADEYPATRRVLREMAIASGYADLQPELFVLDSYSANAFALARGAHRPFIVVTSGLLEHLSPGEQRAVFAHLLARARAGDIQWATAVSALLAPLWRWRDLGLQGTDVTRRESSALAAYVAGERSGLSYASSRSAIGQRSPGRHETELAAAAGVPLFGPLAWLTYTAAVITSELVAHGHRRSQLLAAEVADAEGMLVLKQPADMLRALRRAIELDNRVRLALPLYAQLFYVWAGDDLTDDEDPEWERLDHLQEILGMDGVLDAQRDMLGPAEDEVDIGAPVASRLGVVRSAMPPSAVRIIEIPAWITTGIPGLAAVATSMVSAHSLAALTLTRPIAGPSAVEWVAYGVALRAGEIRALTFSAAAAALAGAVSGRARSGALIGAACAAVVWGIDVVTRSLSPAGLAVAPGVFALGVAGIACAGFLGGTAAAAAGRALRGR